MKLMKKKFKGSIESRLRLIILFVVFSTGALGYAIFVSWYIQNQEEKTSQLSKSIGLVISQDFAKFVLLNQVSVAADITAKLKSFEHLNNMTLYNTNKTPIYQYNKENISFIPSKLDDIKNNEQLDIYKGILHLTLDSKYEDVVLGTIVFEFKVDSLWEIIKRDAHILFGLAFLMSLFSYFLAFLFSKRFALPILQLVKYLEKIDDTTKITQLVTTTEDNEFGALYNEVNIMLERINQSTQEEKIAAVAFETQSGMMITDTNLKILKVNQAFTKITGYHLDEVLGKNPSILNSGIHPKEFYQNMWESIKTQNFWSGEINNKNKSGEIYPEFLTIQVVFDGTNPKYYIGSFLDLSLQKEQEKIIQEKEGLLLQQSKMAAMGEMLENIAHQWRQPLSLISITSSGILMQHELGVLQDDTLDTGMEKITLAVTHLSQTIDDFRNFLKNDKEKSNYSVKESIQKALMLLVSKFKSKNIEVIICEQDTILYGFGNEMIQVFMNIFNNANDAFEDSSTTKRLIIIDIQEENGQVLVSIQDNAGGIPIEILPKIFEHKYTTKERKNGTGIGLYMSKLIVQKVNGKLVAENKTFQYNNENHYGACFIIALPKEDSVSIPET